MKNKVFIFSLVAISIGFFVVVMAVSYINIKKYEYNNNLVLGSVLFRIKEKYPDVDEGIIMDILNDKTLSDNDIWRQYGIDIYDETLSLSNKIVLDRMIVSSFLCLSIYIVLVILIFTWYSFLYNRKIREITRYIEEINNKNYTLDLLSNGETDLSILKNEIYKTTVMLREVADNSSKDKLSLKKSLSDISHQIKTPLTSINIMLDNIIDDDSMTDEVRKDFIINIKREITSINFLVYNILKLSKFDANAIIFKQDEISAQELFAKVLQNVMMISDLKNVKIEVESDDIVFIGDFKWEAQALTNIVKNCIEHSSEDGIIKIKFNDNKLFNEIVIEDNGLGIDDDNLKHIFERFYKVNESDNGFGIGLNLAKMIIEHDDGVIKVNSKVGVGTTFIIRYLKK